MPLEQGCSWHAHQDTLLKRPSALGSDKHVLFSFYLSYDQRRSFFIVSFPFLFFGYKISNLSETLMNTCFLHHLSYPISLCVCADFLVLCIIYHLPSLHLPTCCSFLYADGVFFGSKSGMLVVSPCLLICTPFSFLS
jgi:hypothetical protein